MTVQTQDISDASRLLAMPSPSFFMTRPKLHIFSPIPEDVIVKMQPAWGADYFEARTVEFHMVQDVFIAAEGLVFDKVGNLFSLRQSHNIRGVRSRSQRKWSPLTRNPI
jgi:hypothetical protein